jgi:hypothetical protein
MLLHNLAAQTDLETTSLFAAVLQMQETLYSLKAMKATATPAHKLNTG